jgi:hypothetical protein
MKSVYASAAIGPTISIGPAVTAHVMPQIPVLHQLGTVNPPIDHRHASGFRA